MMDQALRVQVNKEVVNSTNHIRGMSTSRVRVIRVVSFSVLWIQGRRKFSRVFGLHI